MILTDAVIATARDGTFGVTRDAAIAIAGDRIAWAGARADLPAFVAQKRAEGVGIDVKLLMLLGATLAA